MDMPPSRTDEPVSMGRELRPLNINSPVWIQDPTTRRWDTKATMVGISESKRSYTLETADGSTLTRNRRFLKFRYV